MTTYATGCFDLNWEYDAPQYYDFVAGSPAGQNAADSWFQVQASMHGFRSPLAPLQPNANTGVQQQPELHSNGRVADPSQTPKETLTLGSGQALAPKTQPKNIVTSWKSKEDVSTKKKQGPQPQTQSMPPESASKNPGTTTPAVPEEEVYASPMQEDSMPQSFEEQQVLQANTGTLGHQKEFPSSAKRPSPVQEHPTTSKAQRVSEQQHSRFEPRITRSTTKAGRKAASPDRATKAESSKGSLRAAMAKARAIRTAKAAAVATSSHAAAGQPSKPSSAKQVPGTHAVRPTSKAANLRSSAPGGRPRTAVKAPTAASSEDRASGAARAQTSGQPATGRRAAVWLQQQQPKVEGQQQAGDASGDQRAMVAAARPAAMRTRAAQRSKRPSSGNARGDTRSACMPLGVARGSGVVKVKGSCASGTSSRIDPLKLKKMLQARKVLPVRSTKPLTLPEEPVLGPRRSCRHSSQEPESAGHRSPFKPLALKVKEFHTRSPAHHKSQPAPAEPHRPMSMTQPREPTLRTSSRLRASYVKSREEEEAVAMASMPKFHARPLNPLILAGPHTSSAAKAKAAARHAPIASQPFNFVTDGRLQRRHQLQHEESWKALPLNRALLDHPVGLPKRSRMSLTVPKSPALRTRSRTSAQAQRHQQEGEPPSTAFKARPVPDFLQVPREFQSVPREPHPLIQRKPFQLRTDQRGRQHQSRLQAKLSELEQEQEALRVRKAQQLPPTLDHPAVPPKPEPKPLTVPHPFKLRSEVRHEHYLAEFSSHVSEEERQKQAEAEFKARAMWSGVPFRPHESDTPLTAPSEFALATIARASERQAFDQHMEEKWRAIEREKAAAEEAARKAEEEEVRQYRRTLQFKAAPVPKRRARKSAASAYPAKPLTNPKTPQLGRKRKAAESVDE